MRDKRKNNQNGDGLLANFRFRRKWSRATSILSIFVAVGTISALMLPAITMNKVACGQEEHIHGAGCYQPGVTVALSCAQEVHSHTEGCYEEDRLICPLADFLVHSHGEGCYEAGNLVCPLPEVRAHSHEEGCYQVTEIVTDAGHSHGDACYAWAPGETPTCGVEENDGHRHGEGCFAAGTELLCTLAEQEAHSHGDGCYTTRDVLTCTTPEGPGHSHGDGCFGEDGSLICETPEAPGHSHGLECHRQETTLTCTTAETEGHAHGEGCYATPGALLCTTQENDGHRHAEECFGLVMGELICTEEEREPVVEAGEPELICQEPEIALHRHEDGCYTDGALTCALMEVLSHQHGDGCFRETETQLLACEQEEHTHLDGCYEALELLCQCPPESEAHAESCPQYLPWLSPEQAGDREAIQALLLRRLYREDSGKLVKDFAEDHQAMDFENGEAKPVFALTDGVIQAVSQGAPTEPSLIALFLEEQNKTILYYHTDPADSLAPGQEVEAGTHLGWEAARGVEIPGTRIVLAEGERYTEPVADPYSLWEAVLMAPVPEEPQCNCGSEDGVHGEECPLSPKCTCGTEDGIHAEDCPLCPKCTCGTTDEIHTIDCPLYPVPVCTCGSEDESHAEDCPCNLLVRQNPCCEGMDGIHTENCPCYIRPVEFGRNPRYRGVGDLLKSASISTKGRVMFLTANETLAAQVGQIGTEVFESTEDGTVTGSKSITDTNTVDAGGDPIFQIDLNVASTSSTTGESCDFVLVLDMSYSMTGSNLAALKDACTTFVRDLFETSKYSRVAIVTYGGDRNANKYYISPFQNKENSTNTVLSVDTETNLACLKNKSSNSEYQQWYIAHTDNGYVRLINVETGTALEVNGSTLTNDTSYQVRLASESDVANQNWKIIENSSDNTVTFRSEIKSASRNFNLDYVNGETTDGTGVIIWNQAGTGEATGPQKWFLTPVSETPDYETYYWTSTLSESGYEYRTDSSAADSSLLLISQNDGKEINEKLLAAISNLQVYGGKHEGSHPGEAMEKAVRIYQDVRLDDENDYCAKTGEYYYNCKRGVLYFADGTPSPTDARPLVNYPNNDTEGMQKYGAPYGFVQTYVDVQDAINWGVVLKYQKGANIPATDSGVVNGVNTTVEPFNMYFINEKGVHNRSEYYDIGGSTVTGCGATIYVLSINLATNDLTQCNGSSHPETNCAWVDQLVEGGSTVRICKNKANSRVGDGFYDSFDSRSNEYFYRLSSHRKDGTHISFVSLHPRTAAQEAWHKLFGASSSGNYTGWSGRYPDFLCRNQVGAYFVACDNQAAIKEAFKGVAQQLGKELNNLSMVDNLSEYFVVCDEAGVPLNVGDRITMEGIKIPDEEPDPETTFGIISYDPVTDCQAITWKNFDLDPGDGTGANAKTFDASFNVAPREGFIGGNHVPANNGATLSDENGNAILRFENPEVDVPLAEEYVDAPDLNLYLGSALAQKVTLAELKDHSLVKVGGHILDLSRPEEHYGLTWQDDYVTISVILLDEEEKECVEGFSDIRRDFRYSIKMVIDPIFEGKDPTESVSNGAQITVFYPELLFQDTYHHLGEVLPDNAGMDKRNWVQTETKWVSMTRAMSTDPNVTMTSKDVPAITVDYTFVDYSGTTMPNRDQPVDVTVTSVGYATDVHNLCRFAWKRCFPDCNYNIEPHIATVETEEFYLHTRYTVVLPETGGPGTTLYTFSGWALILTACTLMYSTTRKKRKGAR